MSEDTASQSAPVEGMVMSVPQPGWFLCYGYKMTSDDELCIGSCTWPEGEGAYNSERPWEKVMRWNREHEERNYVIISWQRLDDVFECDLEI